MRYLEGQVGRVFTKKPDRMPPRKSGGAAVTVRIDVREDFVREIGRFVAAVNYPALRVGACERLSEIKQ